jgi:hypothetical protein
MRFSREQIIGSLIIGAIVVAIALLRFFVFTN